LNIGEQRVRVWAKVSFINRHKAMLCGWQSVQGKVQLQNIDVGRAENP
jgi:hypothetical protein